MRSEEARGTLRWCAAGARGNLLTRSRNPRPPGTPLKMSKEALREVITALGMIGSMLYVGWEIRQNTAISRVEAYHAIMADQADLFESLKADPGFVERDIKIREGALPEDFSQHDRVLIFLDSVRNLRGWEGLFVAVREGVLPPESLDILGAGGAMETAYFRAIWPELRTRLQGDFAMYLQGRFRLPTD